MKYYIDTAVVISLLTSEDTSATAARWWQRHEMDNLCSSHWMVAELQSGMARKIRMHRLDEKERHSALELFDREIRTSLVLLEVAAQHIAQAGEYASIATLNLRAPDALHLALAIHHGATLITFDHKLAAAAAHFGAPVELLA